MIHIYEIILSLTILKHFFNFSRFCNLCKIIRLNRNQTKNIQLQSRNSKNYLEVLWV